MHFDWKEKITGTVILVGICKNIFCGILFFGCQCCCLNTRRRRIIAQESQSECIMVHFACQEVRFHQVIYVIKQSDVMDSLNCCRPPILASCWASLVLWQSDLITMSIPRWRLQAASSDRSEGQSLSLHSHYCVHWITSNGLLSDLTWMGKKSS